jgi:hypothetical protein
VLDLAFLAWTTGYNETRGLRESVSGGCKASIYTFLIKSLSLAEPPLSVGSSSASRRSSPLYQHLKTHHKALGRLTSKPNNQHYDKQIRNPLNHGNNVQRPALHPRPSQPQRHKRSEFFRIFLCISTSCSFTTAISISCSCFATESSVCVGTTDCARSRARSMARGKWRRKRWWRRKCRGKTFFCLAGATATEVYD